MKSACTLALVLMAAVAVGAQGTAPSIDDRRAVFKTGVDLARIDVQVTDGEGRPISDLRPDEIRVTDEGRARRVVLFQHVAEPRGATYAEAAQRTIASEVSTNRGAPRGHLYVLVFDTRHLTPGREVRARNAAEAFIRNRLRPEDRVAVYSLPGPGAEIYFTNDKAKAIAQLSKVSGSLSRVGVGALGSMTIYEAYQINRGNEAVLARVMTGYSQAAVAHDAIADVPKSFGDDPREFRQLVQDSALRVVEQADASARDFILRLADLVRQLNDYDGRKAVLVFSEGFFPDHVARELEQVEAAAARSYAVIDAVDLNSRGNDPTVGGPIGSDQYTELQDRLEPLGSLATATSGELIVDAGERPEEAFRRVADQSQDYYIVGFDASPDADADSTHPYRHVRVTVTRPGAHVSTRTGYSIQRKPAHDRRSAINLALSAPYPMQGVPIDFTTYTLASDSIDIARVLMSMAAEIPVSAPADVVFAVKDLRDSRVVASGTDTLPRAVAAAPGATTGTATYQVQFNVPPGDYLMRVVVREPGGLVGSADRRFTVRAVGGPGLSAGDMLLRSATATALPVHIVAYSAEPLSGVVELYGRTADVVNRASVSLDLIPVGTDTPVETTIASLEATKTTSTGVSRAAALLVPPGAVPPGQYVARARVRDGHGETIAELERDVEVRAGHAPAEAPASTAAAANPREVLTAEIARQWIAAFGRSVPGVHKAVAAALKREWKKIDTALPARTRQEAAGLALHGVALYAAGDYAGSADALAASFKADPYDARTAFVLGWAYAAAGKDQQAVTAWRNAARLQPSLVPAHLALADVYLKLAQPALATQALRAGLAAVPDSPELRERLARITGS